jgi:N-methylhydantoinase B
LSRHIVIDPITVQVVGNYMRTVANEVEIAMIRAAYSPVIKESFDCSAGIISPSGEYWAQADAIPLQLAVLASVQKNILVRYNQPLYPGDILITNDPFLGAAHLNDFVSIAPIFFGEEIIAFVATLIHHTDVGGMSPGSMPADATEIFQEGFRLPVQKLVSGGAYNESVLEIMLANSRTPTNLLGDLRAQVAASRLGLRRVEEALQRWGNERLRSHVDAYLDYSERLVCDELKRLAPGSYSATRYVDNADPADTSEGARVTADLVVSDDSISIDFSRSSDQTPRPINVVLSNALAASMVALRCMLSPEVPMNGGIQRRLSVACRSGSVMNPVLPAPVGARALVATLAYDCVLECLGQAASERAAASSSGGTTMPYIWAPVGRPGEEPAIMIDNSLTGGAGAHAGADGLDAVDNSVTNAMNYPVEIMEQEFPVLVESHGIRAGSGGPGRWRGGLGLRRVVRFLTDGSLALRGHHYQYPPSGLFGGGPGAATAFWLRRGRQLLPLPPQASGIPTRAGDAFIAETPGGGGFGPPAERDLQGIASDVRKGLLDEKQVQAQYGRVMAPTSQVVGSRQTPILPPEEA